MTTRPDRTAAPAPSRGFKRSRAIPHSVSAQTVLRRGRWTPAVVAAAVLLVGSVTPLPPRYNPDFGPFGPDKGLHLLGHAGFVALLGAGLGEDQRGVATAGGAVVLSTVYGLTTEALQESVAGREFERGDVVAGLLGSLLGLLAW